MPIKSAFCCIYCQDWVKKILKSLGKMREMRKNLLLLLSPTLFWGQNPQKSLVL